jgi:excinuclease ABC subunit C
VKPATPNTPSRLSDSLETPYSLVFERESLSGLPALPGVYVIRDTGDNIIYVGKAKNLRKRVASYFRAELEPKTRSMVSNASTFSFVTAGQENQALVLESNFIKQYKPHFNIQLIDGKSYPLIELTTEAFPVLRKTRRVLTPRNRYFGPYPKAGLLNIGLDTLRRAFPVRTCHRRVDHAKLTKPCLDYDIGLCLAPCASMCSQEEYRRVVEELASFLGGHMTKLLRRLETDIQHASRAQQYERAKRFRDSYLALRGLFERYAVFAPRMRDTDVFAFRQRGNLIAVVRQAIREGRLVASTDFVYSLQETSVLNPGLRVQLAADFYGRYHIEAPSRIAMEVDASSAEIVRTALSAALGHTISLASPKGTNVARLLGFANENADEKLTSYMKATDVPGQLAVLEAVLGLHHLPMRIEGYDVSNIAGRDATVSMVLFGAGRPCRNGYRLFNIRSLETPNDPAMLSEALSRRFARWNDLEFGEPADLVLIDGGVTQVDAVRAVRDAAGLDVPIVGIAKKEELLYVDGHRRPLRLKRDSSALLLLMAIRDEAHRFGKREFHKLHERAFRHK